MIEKKHRQFFVILMIVYFATLSYIVEKSSKDCNVSSYWQMRVVLKSNQILFWENCWNIVNRAARIMLMFCPEKNVK